MALLLFLDLVSDSPIVIPLYRAPALYYAFSYCILFIVISPALVFRKKGLRIELVSADFYLLFGH